MTARSRDANRPPRHLRVGLTLTERGVRVSSVWLVDEPPVSRLALAHPIVASVEVAGARPSVEAHPDPRITRSTVKPGAGHHYGNIGKGTLYVSVPFGAAGELANVKIQVSDFTDVPVADSSREGLAALLQRPVKGMRTVYEVTSEDIRASADWPVVASKLGIPEAVGRFEIYLDRERRYRWRMLRGEREIVADSGQGYRTREACLADLNWIRANAGSLRVTSHDIPGGGAPSSEG